MRGTTKQRGTRKTRRATAGRQMPTGAPLADGVRQRIAEMLDGGAYPPGSKLPPERSLAESLGVNRLTVNRAIGRFVDAGRLRRRVGSGTYVCDPAARHELSIVDVILPYNDRVGDGSSAILGRPGIVEGVHDHFREGRVRTAVSYYRTDADLAAQIARSCSPRDTATIVWYQPGARARDALRGLRSAGAVFCLVDCPQPDEDWPHVGTDEFLGGRLAAGALTDAGRSRLAYLTMPPRQENLAARADGVRHAATEGGASVTEHVVRTPADVPPLVDALLKAGAIDGVVASNDWIALEVLGSLRSHDIAVPADVAVVGYDDVAAARFSTPALTTVAQDFHTVGLRAASLIEQAWRAEQAPAEAQTVSPLLVERETTPAKDTRPTHTRRRPRRRASERSTDAKS